MGIPRISNSDDFEEEMWGICKALCSPLSLCLQWCHRVADGLERGWRRCHCCAVRHKQVEEPLSLHLLSFILRNHRPGHRVCRGHIETMWPMPSMGCAALWWSQSNRYCNSIRNTEFFVSKFWVRNHWPFFLDFLYLWRSNPVPHTW